MKPHRFFLAVVLPVAVFLLAYGILHTVALSLPLDRPWVGWERAVSATDHVAQAIFLWVTLCGMVSAPFLAWTAFKAVRPPLHGRGGMAEAWPWLVIALLAFAGLVAEYLDPLQPSFARNLLGVEVLWCYGAAHALVMTFALRAQDELKASGTSRVPGWVLFCTAELLLVPFLPTALLITLVPLLSGRIEQRVTA